LLYEVETKENFEDVIEKFEEKAKESNFGVLKTYNFKELLYEKGHPIEEEIVVFEICHPKYAQQILSRENRISSFLPCRIAVIRKGEKAVISSPSPVKMVENLGLEEVKDIAEEVDKIIKEIMSKF
jgi:uncharacterized protein (DUF302 family)